MNSAAKTKDPEEPVKLGVWILPSEREELYANTRELGFQNFSDLIRALAALDRTDWSKMEALKSILSGAPEDDADERDWLAIRIKARTGEILRDTARANRFATAADYAGSIIENRTDSFTMDDDMATAVNIAHIGIDNLESRDLALRERVSYLEGLVGTLAMAHEGGGSKQVSIPLLVLKATSNALKTREDAKSKSAKKALENVLRDGRSEKATTEKRGSFVGAPKVEDVAKILTALWELPFSSGPSYKVDAFTAEEIVAVWERAYAQLTGRSFRARYTHDL